MSGVSAPAAPPAATAASVPVSACVACATLVAIFRPIPLFVRDRTGLRPTRRSYRLPSWRSSAERGELIVHRRNFGFRTLTGLDQTLHSRPICLGLILA